MTDRGGLSSDSSAQRPDGVLIFGSIDAGVAELGGVIRSSLAGMATRHLAIPGLQSLAEMNRQLLGELGSAESDPPAMAVSEMLTILRPWADEAREMFLEVLGTPKTADRDLPPWVWADPLNSMLAPFWVEILDIVPASIVVQLTARDVANRSYGLTGEEFDVALMRWSQFSKGALASVARTPATIVSFSELNTSPVQSITRIAKFLAERHVEMEPVQGFDNLVAGWLRPSGNLGAAQRQIPPPARVLDEMFSRFEKVFSPEGDQGGESGLDIVAELGKSFDADYYQSAYVNAPYARGEVRWTDHFAGIAEEICRLLPRRTLDVGCGIGLLVEALRDRGIEATGIDVSAWAVSQVPEELSAFITVASVTAELTGYYDLITCIEVLHELPANYAECAVANMCRHADAILFSSTPDDFARPTHLNVETAAYWTRMFAGHGFYRDIEEDVTRVSPHAVLFRKSDAAVEDVVERYERMLSEKAARVGQNEAAAQRHAAALVEQVVSLEHQLASQSAVAHRDLEELEARRSAEAVAALDALLVADGHQLRMARNLRRVEAERDAAQAHIDGILGTRLYRITWPLRKRYFLSRTAKKVPELVVSDAPPVPEEASYAMWVAEYDTLDDPARDRIRARLATLADPPLISILLPVYNTPPGFLADAITSVRTQLYSNWELCVVDDCSTDLGMAESVQALSQGDARIKYVRREENGHISAASNTALSMATGTWVACLDHDDTLPEHALALFALEVAARPELEVVYSDEDKISEQGVRAEPFFKSEFDPLLLTGQNYLCHLSMYRRSLVEAVGGFREGYEGSQDWDLALRVTEGLQPHQVAHIPRILYHWRIHPASTAQSVSAKSYAGGAGVRAVRDHITRTGGLAEVIPMSFIGWNRVKWEIPTPAPLVSIIIPTRDGKFLSRCIDSIRHRSSYPNYEILVVDNGSLTFGALEYLRAHESWIQVIRDEGPFNYPAINNQAVARSSGEVVCLLNDDTEVLGGDWLEEMVGQLYQPKVGAVGVKLYYSNGQVQHAGVVLGIGGVAGHVHRLTDRLSFADHGRMQLPRSYSAVTAACMVVRRDAWDQVGGLDEVNLPVAFNDIDFCLRLGEAGWRVVWTPFAELTHHESISRGPDTEGPSAIRFGHETRYMKQRWGSILRNDPAYNPNLTLVHENNSLSWPPRVPSL